MDADRRRHGRARPDRSAAFVGRRSVHAILLGHRVVLDERLRCRRRSARRRARLLDFGDAPSVEREALPGGTMRGNSFAALIAPPIREAATVFVNGQRAGAVWAPPYRVDVTALAARRLERHPHRRLQHGDQSARRGRTAAGRRRGDRALRAALPACRTSDNLQPIPSGILSGAAARRPVGRVARP